MIGERPHIRCRRSSTRFVLRWRFSYCCDVQWDKEEALARRLSIISPFHITHFLGRCQEDKIPVVSHDHVFLILAGLNFSKNSSPIALFHSSVPWARCLALQQLFVMKKSRRHDPELGGADRVTREKSKVVRVSLSSHMIINISSLTQKKAAQKRKFHTIVCDLRYLTSSYSNSTISANKLRGFYITDSM